MKTKTRKTKMNTLKYLLFGTVLSALPFGASAQDLYFDPTSGGNPFPQQSNGNWETPNAWFETPGDDTFKDWIPGAIARFQGDGNAIVTMTDSQTAGGITKITWGGNFTVINMAGNTLTLSNGAIISNNENILALQNGNIAGTNVTVTGGATVRIGDDSGFDTIANTLSGVTVEGSSNLALAQAPGSAAVSGAVTLNSGFISFNQGSQLGANTVLTQNDGTLFLGSTTETIESLVLNGGARSSVAPVQFNLTGADAYTTRNVNFGTGLTGTAGLHLAGTNQTVRFDATNDGTGEIVSNMTFTDGIKTFNVENGAEIADLRLGGTIQMAPGASSATMIKEGAGALEVFSAISFGGDILVNEGTLSMANGSSIEFMIGANGVNNQVSGALSGSAFFDGQFIFDLSSAATVVGSEWLLVDRVSLGSSDFFGNFNVAGFNSIGGGLWELDSSGTVYQFNEATGTLSVIPEPGVAAILIPVFALIAVFSARKHKK